MSLLSAYDDQGRVRVAKSVTRPGREDVCGCDGQTFWDLITLCALSLFFEMCTFNLIGIVVTIGGGIYAYRLLRDLSAQPYYVRIYRRQLGRPSYLRRGRHVASLKL